MLVVSSYDCIHEVLVTKGAAFSDRMDNFRTQYVMNDDMFAYRKYDATCQTLRKLSHRFMKQFGDGLSELEVILQDAEKRMISAFEATQRSPVNTLDIMKETALYSITVLLMGRPVDPNEQLWEMLLRYESAFTGCLSSIRLDMMMLDKFPWLIHFPLQCSREIKGFAKLQDDLWDTIKENHRQMKYDSLTKVLLEHVANGSCGNFTNLDDRYKLTGITDRQAGLTCLVLLVAGVLTTPVAIHLIVNILACRQDTQDKIREEVERVLLATGRDEISLKDKSMMPYLRATILESMRHFPTAPLGGNIRQTVKDTELSGHGTIPKGTRLMINTWALHHDKEFWGDPEVFRPERFLDDSGALVEADHPNRRHVLLFGAGQRQCIGEIFAHARLFLWSTALVKRFKITIAPGFDPDYMDPTRPNDDGILVVPTPCDVIFTPID